MPDLPKTCPQCGEEYQWYEAECRECGVALVPVARADAGNPGLGIVSVFRTDDPGLLPLAKMALEAEGIAYQVANEPRAGIEPQAATYRNAQAAAEIFVAEDDALRARDVLADLLAAGDAMPMDATGVTAAAPDAGELTVRLDDNETRQHVGDISEAQLEFLLSQLEQESPEDRDFYINSATIDVLADQGADAALVGMLRAAIGEREGMEITWTWR